MANMLELEVPIRGQRAQVWLLDVQVRNSDELRLIYRVFLTDPDDDGDYEITNPTPEETQQIHDALMKELDKICS